MNKKNTTTRRVAAWIGIIALIGLYVFSLVQAFVYNADSFQVFLYAVAGTITIPIVIWLFLWVYSAFTGKHNVASLDAMSSNLAHDERGNVIRKTPEGKIKTIIFDIGNVLVDFDWKSMFQSRGYDEAMTERIAKASVFASQWKEWDRGEWTYEEILDAFVSNDPEIETQIRDALRDMKEMIHLRPETLPWIHGLQDRGYQVLVLSNFSELALKDNEEAMAFLKDVDGGILSYRDKVIKPDPAIYQLLLQRYDLKAEECIFIDDTLENITAANKEGIHGILFDTRDHVVEQMHELGVDW